MQHQVGVEVAEYESDDDGASALALRRRAASDDDERGTVMDAASSTNDDASRPRFSDDEGEGPGVVRLQTFSLDVQPSGLRFTTAGGDHKVCISNMKPLGEQESGSSASVNKLLAIVRDHFGSVNCVRWAKCGQLIASGLDDQVILAHERRPGLGTMKFGSGEPPDVENWKVLLTSCGHTADVVDLGWSPDNILLANCSLDNTIHVWLAATSSPVTVLTSHCRLVKGVTWDPIGSFLATQ
ncbi:unnamed protein product [Sphagnum balticum]